MTTNWQWTKEEVEDEFDVTLTKRQWEIILEEVDGREDWEEPWDVIEEVVLNIESYEEEHDWWGERLRLIDGE